MKQIESAYALSAPEIVLLKLFNLLDADSQNNMIHHIAGYLVGRGFIDLDESVRILKEKD